MTEAKKRVIGSNEYYNTVTLYADDSYIREFDAEVLKAGPRFVVLDRTAFYPESGGQPSDTGVLRTETGDVKVHKVMKRGRDIFHYLEGNLSAGASVHGVIDWDQRYYNMRRHSAEHLLTGLFEEAGSGPKVYSDMTRLDFKPSNLTEETVRQVESEFNEAVEASKPVLIYYASRDELDVGDDERKKAFLEKIPQTIERLRIVEIPGYALTFCFGTHVGSTEEIGRLKRLELKKGKKQTRVIFFTLE